MNSPRPLLTILAAILSLGIVGSTAAPPNYVVTKLGTLGDDFGFTIPYGINNGGRVVGQFTLDSTPHAFRSFHGMMEDLGTLGGQWAVAHDINSSGVIVGMSEDSSGNVRPFRYRRGHMEDLGIYGYAYAINNRGDIVGQSSSRAFLFRDGSTRDLGTLGGTFSVASDINESGTIVGNAGLPNGLGHAFVYESGVMHDLGTPGGELGSYAFSINNHGVIVGSAQLPDLRTRAVVFEPGRIHDLGSLGGRESFAIAINDHGIIVGNSTTAVPSQRQHAFVYTDGVMYDLHDFIVAAEPDADAVRSSFAHAINARGQIAVQAAVQFRGFVSVRGYVLSPRHGGGWKEQ